MLKNSKNYKDAKDKIGGVIYRICIEDNRLLSLMPGPSKISKMLQGGDGGEKSDETSASKPQSNIGGAFVDGKWRVGAKPLGSVVENKNVSLVPNVEEQQEEISDESGVVPTSQVDDLATSNTNAGILPDEEKKKETSEAPVVAPNPADDSRASDTNAVPDEDQQNETTKAPDLLIPSASMANDNPEGRQKLKIAEVGEKIGGLLWGPVGQSIGRVFGQALDHIVETSARNANAAQQNVNSGNDRSAKENNSDTCYHNGNNSNLKDTDVHGDPADIEAQADLEREGRFFVDQATISHEDCNGNNSATLSHNVNVKDVINIFGVPPSEAVQPSKAEDASLQGNSTEELYNSTEQSFDKFGVLQ